MSVDVLQFIKPELRKDYIRWEGLIVGNDNFSTPNTISVTDILKAHYLIADFFLEEGKELGGIGPKSLHLLQSATCRQHACYGGVCKWSDKYDVAATLLYGLVKDHPFHDANKRTAFLSILFFLQRHDVAPSVPHEEFEDFLVEIADDTIRNKKRFKELNKDTKDPEILYISWWLRQNTRKIDKTVYTITYRELRRILNSFDFDLINPHGNMIDVVKKVKSSNLYKYFMGKEKICYKKIGTMGFPGYTKQVPKGELKKLRELTDLTPKRGVDSQVFYNGIDSLELLLGEYQEPLRRLADR